jgi:YHS domain-containing protein
LRFAEVSTAMQTLLMDTGIPPSFGREVQALHCPMYRRGQGGTIWLQPAGDVRNPYFGATMLDCFDERKALPVTGGSQDATEPGPDTAEPQSQTQPPTSPTAASTAQQGPDDYPIDFCLVSGEKLGSMGVPVTLEYEGRTLKFCCAMCISSFRDDPDTYLKKLDEAAKTLGRTTGAVKSW